MMPNHNIQQKLNKKLMLRKETIRELTAIEMRNVAGGKYTQDLITSCVRTAARECLDHTVAPGCGPNPPVTSPGAGCVEPVISWEGYSVCNC